MRVVLRNTKVAGGRIEYAWSCEPSGALFMKEAPYVVEYSDRIDHLDPALLRMPFVGAFYPWVAAAGGELVLDVPIPRAVAAAWYQGMSGFANAFTRKATDATIGPLSDSAMTAMPEANRAALCYSGGLDSTFAAALQDETGEEITLIQARSYHAATANGPSPSIVGLSKATGWPRVAVNLNVYDLLTWETRRDFRKPHFSPNPADYDAVPERWRSAIVRQGPTYLFNGFYYYGAFLPALVGRGIPVVRLASGEDDDMGEYCWLGASYSGDWSCYGVRREIVNLPRKLEIIRRLYFNYPGFAEYYRSCGLCDDGRFCGRCIKCILLWFCCAALGIDSPIDTITIEDTPAIRLHAFLVEQVYEELERALPGHAITQACGRLLRCEVPFTAVLGGEALPTLGLHHGRLIGGFRSRCG